MMNKKHLVYVVIALIGVPVLAAWWFLGRAGEREQYRTAPVERGNLTASVSATGTVNAVVSVLVGSQVSGTIYSLHADFNSVVKKGQVIARLDPALFETQVAQARANLLNAEAEGEKARVTVADTRRNRERLAALYAKGYVSKSELDAAETAYEAAEAALRAARSRQVQAKASLDQTEVNLKYTIIRSPVDGIVIARNVDVGQTVAASLQAPTLFTIAQDLTKMQVDTNVDEADIGRVAVGQEGVFTVDAFPQRRFQGKVVQVRSAPQIIQNVVTYDAVVEVDNTDLRLRPGMTANVQIITARREGALLVPNRAFRVKPAERPEARNQKPEAKNQAKKAEGERQLWVLEDGKPAQRKVRTGLYDAERTEVLDGVQEGEAVIVEAMGMNARSSLPAGARRLRGIP
jgi:HlyD family secretion protein